MSAYDIMKIGRKIVSLRKARGMKQNELADALQVSQGLVSLWERDKNVPTLGDALTLSRLFGVSLDYLADDAMDTPPGPPMTAEEAYVLRVFRNSGLDSDEASRRIMATTTGTPGPMKVLGVRDMTPRDPEPAASTLSGRAGKKT